MRFASELYRFGLYMVFIVLGTRKPFGSLKNWNYKRPQKPILFEQKSLKVHAVPPRDNFSLRALSIRENDLPVFAGRFLCIRWRSLMPRYISLPPASGHKLRGILVKLGECAVYAPARERSLAGAAQTEVILLLHYREKYVILKALV